jgi:hypothetical protein
VPRRAFAIANGYRRKELGLLRGIEHCIGGNRNFALRTRGRHESEKNQKSDANAHLATLSQPA